MPVIRRGGTRQYRRHLKLLPPRRPPTGPLPWGAHVWPLPAAAALALTVALAVAAASPGVLPDGFGWARESSGAGAALVGLLLLALAAAALLGFSWPRRGQPRPFTLIAGLALGLVGVVLGLASYLPCGDAGTPIISPAFWTLALFAANVQDVWGPDGCAPTRPLALAVASLAALSATFAGAGAVLAAATGQQWDRLRMRLSTSNVVVAGLAEECLTLLPGLEHKYPDGLLAVVESDRDHPLLGRARAAGARVLADDLTAETVARAVMVRGGRLSGLAVYLLDPDVAVNLKRLETVQQVMAGVAQRERHSKELGDRLRRDGRVPRITVRIDDPWHVEEWRREHFVAPGGVGIDAVSVYETTAQLLLDRIVQPESRLVVVGTSRLTLALLTELAQRQREATALAGAFGLPEGAAAKPVPTEVVVVDPDASSACEDHRLLQGRFGNAPLEPALRALDAVGDEEVLRPLLDPGGRTSVVFAGRPSGESLDVALRLAARHPTVSMWCWSEDGEGISDTTARASLRTFGLCFAVDDVLPDTSWDRVARLLHEGYRARFRPSGSSGLPWDSPAEGREHALHPFFRQSNIRHIRLVLDAVRQQHRTWGAVESGSGASACGDDDVDVDVRAVAHAEHSSWRLYYEENGWRYGPRAEGRHPLLKSWGDLTDDEKVNTVETVKETLRLLHVLGYRATPT